MTQQFLSDIRETAELAALKSAITFHGLDADDLLTRYFSKLNNRGITNVFEIETFLSVANKSVSATIKTTSGSVGLQIYKPRNKMGTFEIKLVDVQTQVAELLFIMTSDKDTTTMDAPS